MKNALKTYIIMSILFLASACSDEEITPKFAPLKDWNQSGSGAKWYTNYQNEFIGTTGEQQSRLVSNPHKSTEGLQTLLIEIDNRSTQSAKLDVYSSTKEQSVLVGSVVLVSGKLTYSVQVDLPSTGCLGLQVVGESFNLDVLSIRQGRRSSSGHSPRPR